MSEAAVSAVLARRHMHQVEPATGSILIIDDEAAIRESLETLLAIEGYSVETARTAEEGLAMFAASPHDLLLLDFALPDRNGLDVLDEIRQRDPGLPVIMITAYGTVENAVKAIQAGATNFIQKPWDNEKLLADVRASISRLRMEEENRQLKRALKQRYNFENIVGKSEPMLKIFDLVAQVAPSRSTVLIQGDSGTGKELIAKAIHASSPRKDGPFVPVNTGSMPTELLESTLFGHVKGAFTSAIASKKGLFEIAHKGTLFLDEIGTMGLDTQAKILRVLQDRKFMHLGGVQEVQVDVRIIAATNVDLRQLVKVGIDLLPDSILGESSIPVLTEQSSNASLFDIMEECERRVIVGMLEKCSWNQTEAAERFRIPLSTLNQKIKRLSIEVRKRGREN